MVGHNSQKTAPEKYKNNILKKYVFQYLLQNASAKRSTACIECCLLTVCNVHILEQQQLALCAKLYCKRSSLTPGVKQLIPVAHRQNLSLHLPRSSACRSASLLRTGSFQQKTPLFNNLYSCVIIAGYGHFWLSDMAADPTSALKPTINRNVTKQA